MHRLTRRDADEERPRGRRLRYERRSPLRLLGLVVLLPVASASSADPWDVAPANPTGATAPLLCPGGDGQVTAADALVALRRALDIVTGFACNGAPIGDAIVDVSPPSGVDSTVTPIQVIAGGDGQVTAADALLILRAALGLIKLVPAAIDLSFDASVAIASDPAPIFASDAGTTRNATLIATVLASGSTGSTPAVSLCAFTANPLANPSLAPLACEDQPPFAAGERRNVTIVVPAPSAIGPFTVWLFIDAGAALAEPDEANNVKQGNLTVVPAPLPEPDLAFQPLAPLEMSPIAPVAGTTANVTAHLENVGTGPAPPPFAVDLFFDRTVPPQSGDCGIFEPVHAGIAAGATLDVTWPVALPAGVAPGPHRLWAVADTGFVTCKPNGDIQELNEANNTTFPPLSFCVGSKAVQAGDKIDLRADAIDITFAGQSFGARGRFTNAGTRDVVPFALGAPQPPARVRLTVTVSGTQPIEFDDDRSCLPVGATGAVEPNQSFPILASPVRVELQLDPLHEIPESDETNNARCVLVSNGTTNPC